MVEIVCGIEKLVTIKEKGCWTKKGIKGKMKTCESKICFLYAYHFVVVIVL
jgi:hypothetical protein